MEKILSTLLNCLPDSYGSPEGEPVAKTPTYSVPSSSYAPASSDYAPPPPSAPVGPPSTGYESAGRPPKRTSDNSINLTSLGGHSNM